MTRRPSLSPDQTTLASSTAQTTPVQQGTSLSLVLQERRVVTTLLTIVGFLLVAGLISVIAQSTPKFFGRDLFVGLFSLEGESNAPAAFSALILLLAALLLGVIAWAKKQAQSADAFSWKALTFIFGFLALDEAAQLHERLTNIVRRSMDAEGPLRHAWVVPYGILALIVLFSFVRFLAQLPSTIRWRVILAGIIYVLGALGFEVIEGMIVTAAGMDSLANRLAIVAEEGLEMLGVTLFIGALLSYIRLYLPELKLRLSVGASPSEQPTINDH